MRPAQSLVLVHSSKRRFIRSLETTNNAATSVSGSKIIPNGTCPSCSLRRTDLILHVDLLYVPPEILSSISRTAAWSQDEDLNASTSKQFHLLDLPYDVLMYLLENHLSPIHTPKLAVTCKKAARICVENGLLQLDLPLSPELQPPRCACPETKTIRQSLGLNLAGLKFGNDIEKERRNMETARLSKLRRKAHMVYANTLAELGSSSQNLFFAIYINRKRIISELCRTDRKQPPNWDEPNVPYQMRVKPYYGHKIKTNAQKLDYATTCETALNKHIKLMRDIASLSLCSINAADTAGVRDLVWCTGIETCELVGTKGGGYRIKQEFEGYYVKDSETDNDEGLKSLN